MSYPTNITQKLIYAFDSDDALVASEFQDGLHKPNNLHICQ
jgi:hypothetical protein